MKTFRTLFVPVLLFFAVLVSAQTTAPNAATATQTILVLPFENSSKAPGIEWISEAIPEVLNQRLNVPGLYVISREDRNYAFDRMGIPSNVRPSRATLYRIAEQMDADQIVLGDYNFDGQTFTAHAQVLDMKKLRLSQELASNGPLVNLMEVSNGLAYEVLRTVRPQAQVDKAKFLDEAKPIRLDAFENYIRGILTTDREEKISRLKQAVKLDPQYRLAMLQLGRTYFNDREYDNAAAWLSRVPANDPNAGESNFLLGLSYYYLGQFDKAEAAFKVTESKAPLTEVVNDVGVAMSRRNRPGADDYFERAVKADPADPDYRFNLALTLWKRGDAAGATRNLKESVDRHPTDVEAHQLLDAIASTAPNATRQNPAAVQAARNFVPRIKRNYDETSYRQLAVELMNAMTQSAAKSDPRRHAQMLVEQGEHLLDTGMDADAEKDFRLAVVEDPTNAAAHAGLARSYEKKNDDATARSEANTALRLAPLAQAHLVLARLAAKANDMTEALRQADQALWIEPSNADALALKHELAAKKQAP